MRRMAVARHYSDTGTAEMPKLQVAPSPQTDLLDAPTPPVPVAKIFGRCRLRPTLRHSGIAVVPQVSRENISQRMTRVPQQHRPAAIGINAELRIIPARMLSACAMRW